MTANKLFVLFLSALFLLGTGGLAVAQKPEEKKVEKKADEKKMEKAAVKAKTASGTLKTASADSVTIVAKDKKEWKFSVDPKTAIKKAGKAVAAADLKEGDPVNVRFTEADGKMMAQSVTVPAPPKKAEKKAEQPCAAKK